MGSKWQTQPLEELVTIHDSKRVPITKDQRKEGPYPYYGASGITDFVEGYIYDGLYLLLAEDGDNLRTRNTPIAFTASGKFWVNNHAHVLQGVDQLDTKFICYALQYSEIDSYISGSTRPKITQADLRKIPVSAPPLNIRHLIAAFIEKFDDKITLNRQINQTLEQMAQTLFKSWFVDFDPVIDNALDAGNDIPDTLQERAEQRRLVRAKVDFKPLPAETRALFPSEFEETELGWVPKGWTVQPFSEISDILNGCAFKSEDYVEKGNFVLRTKNFTKNQVERYSDDAFLPDSFFESHSQFLCKPYDYHLVMVGASVGNCAIIYPHQLPAFRNQNMWCFRSKKPDFISQSFIKYLLDFVVAKSLGLASGSAREFFRKGDFGNQLVCSGEGKIQMLFKNICESYLSKMGMLCAENERLIELRDTLLPKLISGELELDALPEAPELAEAR